MEDKLCDYSLKITFEILLLFTLRGTVKKKKKKNYLSQFMVNPNLYFESEIESEVTCGQVQWPILRICALHLTHPSAHTHSSEHTPGAVGSSGHSRAPQSWYWRRRERCTFTPPPTIPAGPRARKIASPTSRGYCVFQSGYQNVSAPCPTGYLKYRAPTQCSL